MLDDVVIPRAGIFMILGTAVGIRLRRAPLSRRWELEAQRLTAKLLSERGREPNLPATRAGSAVYALPPDAPFSAIVQGGAGRSDVNILFPQGVPEELVMMVIAVCAMIVIVVIGGPIVRMIANRVMRRPPPAALPTDVSQRLERIESAVDTMAIEVERISEAQRYTAKLLTDATRSLQALRLPRDGGSAV